MAPRRQIFNEVFPSFTNTTTPTPTATPVLGSSPFVGSSSFSEGFAPGNQQSAAAETIRKERAWHDVTAFLSLPNQPVTADGNHSAKGKWPKPYTQEVSASIIHLLSTRPQRTQSKAADLQDDIIDWYAHEVGKHFVDVQLPVILKLLNSTHPSTRLTDILKFPPEHAVSAILNDVLSILSTVQSMYLNPLKAFILPVVSSTGNHQLSSFLESSFLQGHHALVAKLLCHNGFTEYLRNFFLRTGSTLLSSRSVGLVADEDAMEEDHTVAMAELRDAQATVIKVVEDVGLGGAYAQRIFAEVMSELLTEYINSDYAGKWTSPSTIPEQLREWVENQFARFVVEMLVILDGGVGPNVDPRFQVTFADVASWQQRAICDLGTLRLKELFEVVVDWDNDSKGAIEDLKHYLTNPAARAHLTNYFSGVISTRLLQPGASTTEILQVYTCIIRAFAALDPKGVLLDRLARPIRRYLRERDDTVKIIVGGLLADADDDSNTTDAFVELAIELNKITEIQNADDDDGELDWDDMSWVPDPVDAGPDFKKSKNSDVIGTLISIFESKDIFVKEFQNMMGERLLKKDFEFDKEIRVLELLKLRFGDAALQACEVMLRDILDSRRVDAVIHKEEGVDDEVGPGFLAPDFHTKILSRLFWPALNGANFSLPWEIQEMLPRYSDAFLTLKQSRTLTWFPALGQATIEIHLADRTITEEVTTWQATVINLFHDPDHSAANPISFTFAQLLRHVEMDKTLLLSALTFWVSKLVLRESPPGTYTVLETLSPTDLNPREKTNQAAQAAAAADAISSAAATTSAIRSEEDVASEKMNVFWQFIVGMLTNQGAMPLAKIVMMLKFAVPGGFPYGNEELKEFLGKMVQEEKLEVVGGNYRIVK